MSEHAGSSQEGFSHAGFSHAGSSQASASGIAASVPLALSAPVALSAKGLTKRYRIGAENLEVLRGVDLDVREGEILAILGTSGSGKSTLLHVLGWLDHADAGTIHYEGRDRASLSASERANLRNRVMGFVFQFYHLLPELTALENVMLPSMILHSASAWRSAKHEARARAERMLDRVGLGKRQGHRPSQLSGGERQRVAIARALQNQPRFLLCDEPTGNLDGKTAADIRRLLWDLNASDHQTLVVVTHDVRLAKDAHRAVHLVDGRVVMGAGLDAVVAPPSIEDLAIEDLAESQGLPGIASATRIGDAPASSEPERPPGAPQA